MITSAEQTGAGEHLQLTHPSALRRVRVRSLSVCVEENLVFSAEDYERLWVCIADGSICLVRAEREQLLVISSSVPAFATPMIPCIAGISIRFAGLPSATLSAFPLQFAAQAPLSQFRTSFCRIRSSPAANSRSVSTSGHPLAIHVNCTSPTCASAF